MRRVARGRTSSDPIFHSINLMHKILEEPHTGVKHYLWSIWFSCLFTSLKSQLFVYIQTKSAVCLFFGKTSYVCLPVDNSWIYWLKIEFFTVCSRWLLSLAGPSLFASFEVKGESFLNSLFFRVLVTKFWNEEWDLARYPQDGIFLHTLHSNGSSSDTKTRIADGLRYFYYRAH